MKVSYHWQSVVTFLYRFTLDLASDNIVEFYTFKLYVKHRYVNKTYVQIRLHASHNAEF